MEKELASAVYSFQFIGMKTNDRRSWLEYKIQIRDQGNLDNFVKTIVEKYVESKVVVRVLLVMK